MSNQIVGFCDYKYLWKESPDILDCGDGHQGKEASETTLFVMVLPGVSSQQYLKKKLSYQIYFLYVGGRT